MAGLWKRAMEVLGLSDGDAYSDYEAYEDQGGAPPMRRSPQARPDGEGVAAVRPMAQPSGQEHAGSSGVTVLPRCLQSGRSPRSPSRRECTRRRRANSPTAKRSVSASEEDSR